MKEYRPRDEGTYVAYSTPGKQIARFAIVNDTTVIFAIFAANSLDAGDLSGPTIQTKGKSCITNSITRDGNAPGCSICLIKVKISISIG